MPPTRRQTIELWFLGALWLSVNLTGVILASVRRDIVWDYCWLYFSITVSVSIWFYIRFGNLVCGTTSDWRTKSIVLASTLSFAFATFQACGAVNAIKALIELLNNLRG